MKIVIATHKSYWMPEDFCYLPLHVGCEGKTSLGYVGDNSGDNISTKNGSFCELTGLYWAWKNLDEDYIGLAHYRRHFAKGLRLCAKNKRRAVLGEKDFRRLLEKHDVILPKKRHYFIETSRSQYEHAHNPQDLVVMEEILRDKYPDYMESFRKVMGSSSGHRFNMFVMRKNVLHAYCEWLFDILFELEARIDISTYNAYNSRVFGFLSERLLDIWIVHNKINYCEQSVLFLENQQWILKIFSFLKRKIVGSAKFTK